MKLLYKDSMMELYHGNSSDYEGDCDLVLTNPYALLPWQFNRKPMLICDRHDRLKLAERRCGTSLQLVSHWYNGINTIWCGNVIPINVDLTDMVPHKEGWFPEELARRLLTAYAKPGDVVWDGFMGRGTVGKVCRELGLKYIGIDHDLEVCKIALEYLGHDRDQEGRGTDA